MASSCQRQASHLVTVMLVHPTHSGARAFVAARETRNTPQWYCSRECRILRMEAALNGSINSFDKCVCLHIESLPVQWIQPSHPPTEQPASSMSLAHQQPNRLQAFAMLMCHPTRRKGGWPPEVVVVHCTAWRVFSKSSERA